MQMNKSCCSTSIRDTIETLCSQNSLSIWNCMYHKNIILLLIAPPRSKVDSLWTFSYFISFSYDLKDFFLIYPTPVFYHNHHPYVCLIGSLQNWYKKVSFVIAREIFFIVLLRWGFSVSCCSHRSHPVSFNYQWDRLDECSGCTGLNWP